MRYLTIPADVSVAGLGLMKGNKDVAVIDFSEGFFITFILPRLPLNTSEGSDTAMSLAEKVGGKKSGEVIALTDKEHEALQKTLAAVQQNMPPTMLVRFLSHFHAINAAPSEEPKAHNSDQVEAN